MHLGREHGQALEINPLDYAILSLVGYSSPTVYLDYISTLYLTASPSHQPTKYGTWQRPTLVYTNILHGSQNFLTSNLSTEI